jgi:diguanylate cyclase (GGDEF)-like protein/PAS domain S-box-containing protein
LAFTNNIPDSLASSDNLPLVPVVNVATSLDSKESELNRLLQELATVATASQVLPPVFSEAVDSQLVQVRLGIAASLFAALQCKNAAVAGHALRVALTCSAWALKLELSREQRDAVEVAALLHDIGIVGAPDHILMKPSPLNSDEATVMVRARQMSVTILSQSCNSPQVLEIIENVSAWYDGSRPGFQFRGEKIPFGARMIAIAEAFDAMVTDHVFRPARSQERAMAELFECAGSQFDPELVQLFAKFHEEDQAALYGEVAQRWLHTLDPELVNSYWELHSVPAPCAEPSFDAMFQAKLLENMYDAVVFIDGAGQITLWNRGAERLTGIGATTVRNRTWGPELLNMADEKGQVITDADCPVQTAIRCGAQSLRRLTIDGRGDRPVAVDTHAIPVLDNNGAVKGAILLFHDASSEMSLEQKCQSLHERATKDPMTQVANRAEFDRVHTMFIATHQQQQVPCSLIICDLDRFKTVNDTYGHQAGDDAIKSLASLMKNLCRPGDLVARYGGEEFVLLCADCGNAAATRRAEQIRRALSCVAQPRMGGRAVTASFGVTEVQPGDTPDTMLRRSDRALLMAKSKGRNCVIQLGSGGPDEGEPATFPTPTEERYPDSDQPMELVQQDLVTPVPVKIAVEKLRGFVADHRATVVAITGNEVELEIDDRQLGLFRRLTDRPVVFCIRLRFEEERLETEKKAGMQQSGQILRTRIQITISLRNDRDRRRKDNQTRAQQVLVSFRSYLMANERGPEPAKGTLTRVKRALAPWLLKR